MKRETIEAYWGRLRDVEEDDVLSLLRSLDWPAGQVLEDETMQVLVIGVTEAGESVVLGRVDADLPTRARKAAINRIWREAFEQERGDPAGGPMHP
ncbi:MAG: hypothetical protein ACODAA_00870 [Gemmatimonadota bacterium]